jgi:hypothetical protein
VGGAIDAFEACGLLVRPDGYVAWAADTFEPDDNSLLLATLTRWFGAEHQASVALMPTVT